MTKKKASILIIMVVTFIASYAQADDLKIKVQASMKALKAKLTSFGPVKIEGMGTVSGKQVPVIYFGQKKINEKYDVVDEIKKLHGGTATVFVKSGDEFIRVSTNVMKDGESRAIGTLLARNPAYDAIKKGDSYFGQVDILGRKYETGYEPIKNNKGEVVGIFYVGYPLK